MNLAILETGTPPTELIARFGRYPEMIERLLGSGFDYATCDVAAGKLPRNPFPLDANKFLRRSSLVSSRSSRSPPPVRPTGSEGSRRSSTRFVADSVRPPCSRGAAESGRAWAAPNLIF